MITHLFNADGELLMIRGEDPAEIHRLAVLYVTADGWLEVADTPEDIRVTPIRAIPTCGESCGCGNPGTHYLPVRRGGRGSFRGAFVNIHTRGLRRADV